MEYKDYYGTLGVAKDASQDEIQKAYRKLARKYHPDINKGSDAQARFQEINEAHEVLKDPEKRAKYDRFGSAWKQAQRSGAPPSGFEDIFSQFGFGGGAAGGSRRVDFDLGDSGFSSFFETLFGGGQGGRVRWGFDGAPRQARQTAPSPDNEARISLSIEEAGRGGKREISLKDPTSGRLKRLRVTIPKGIRPGQKIRLAGQGSPGPGGRRGDLYLTVEILPHPRFRLSGSDLLTEIPVAPWEAALGGTARLPTLEGEVSIRIPPGSSSGRKIRLRGKGFPGPGGGNGDLLAEIRIVVPKKLSETDQRLYEQLAESSEFRARG